MLALPTVLSGANLGQRHHYLNSLVNQTAGDGKVLFEDIEVLKEETAVGRLFKIDVAIKLNNVEYVLKNLKDDDMLYVSRALKCSWLVERRDLINPKYLEDELFPEMIMPAISKMKHYLYTNLKDPVMCQVFYQYYKPRKLQFALKFLHHCSNEYLLDEFPKILIHVTPHILKVLGEKNPKLVKIYFDSLASDNNLVKQYLKNEQKYYNSTKCLLKSELDTFLDITEKYHNLTGFKKLSPLTTEYILCNCKSRFLKKSELYIVYLLHIPTVARLLSVAECREAVINLARAEYLNWWFSYEKVETLVKRVDHENRAAFKKTVFVEKSVGDKVSEWPYVLPGSPVVSTADSGKEHVFHDQDYEPILMSNNRIYPCGFNMRYCCAQSSRLEMTKCLMSIKMKTELDKLFDEFRFVGFAGTLHELRGRINATSSADRRRDMLLVLVSKSGGRPDSVRSLMELALRLSNEPVHERATIVRSLVKRASAWRLPQDVWDSMLEYGHGLGLDGTGPEANCVEGLHGVVLRQLLATGNCDPAISTAFLENFSTLYEYKLTAKERSVVSARLQHLLSSTASDAKPDDAAKYLNYLLDILKKYNISFQAAVLSVVALVQRDAEVSKSLLVRLYEARVGRRELLRQYLEFRHDDTALVNVIRHDPDALKLDWLVKLLIDENTRADQFFLKIALYFNEPDGIAIQLRRTLQDKIVETPEVKLARPLAALVGKDMSSVWHEQDLAGGERLRLAAALRANMHRARPAPDALALGWREAGMKAVAWRATRSRPSQVTPLIQTLLQERVKRTVRLALVLAKRTTCAADIFATANTIRPIAVLRAALPYYRSLGEKADARVWDIVKDQVLNVDLTTREGLRCILKKVEWVPKTMKPEYCTLLYIALDTVSDRSSREFCHNMMECLPELKEDLLKQVLSRMLANVDLKDPVSFPAIVIRYLMLSKSEEEEKLRFEDIGQQFLNKLHSYRESDNETKLNFFKDNLEQIMTSVQYNTAFFDLKHNCCLRVIERVLTWVSRFLPKESHFKNYVHIHATMLYYKAIRQSIKQNSEVFEDPDKKLTEGVEIVGFTFGRYIVKESLELKSKFFESIIEIYRHAFTRYLNNYFQYSKSKGKLIAAITKGILSESVGSEARLAVHVLQSNRYEMEDAVAQEIKETLMKSENKEVQFFMHAQISA